jgi:thioredoxin-like negative regulator of GroEL
MNQRRMTDDEIRQALGAVVMAITNALPEGNADVLISTLQTTARAQHDQGNTRLHTLLQSLTQAAQTVQGLRRPVQN